MILITLNKMFFYFSVSPTFTYNKTQIKMNKLIKRKIKNTKHLQALTLKWLKLLQTNKVGL